MFKFKDRLQRVSKKTGVLLTKGTYYRNGIQECWKCKEDIIVFAWPNEGLWENNSPIEKPIPQTVKFLEKSGYWGNLCPFCGSLQGDFSLKWKKREPFSVSCKDDSAESFQDDLLNMAHMADLNGLLKKLK